MIVTLPEMNMRQLLSHRAKETFAGMHWHLANRTNGSHRIATQLAADNYTELRYIYCHFDSKQELHDN